MRVITTAIVTTLLFAVSVSAGTLAVNGHYLFGLPVSDSIFNASWIGGGWLEYDMTDGVKYKPGPLNFGGGVAYMFTPIIGIEGGVEYHSGYKNDDSTIVVEGDSYIIDADTYKDRHLVVCAGARFGIPTSGAFSPFFDGGLTLLFNKQTDLVGMFADYYSTGTHIGIYAGGGLNIRITRHISIHCPVKFRNFFSGEYTNYDSSGAEIEGGFKMTPFSVLSVGVGMEFYPLG
ncbi:MAG: porin family protein [bacterium]|nr:porin family protein [bacterium]